MDTNVIIALMISFVLLVLLLISRSKSKKTQQNLDSKLKETEQLLRQIEIESNKQKLENSRLNEKYSPITDMEAYAKELLNDAEEKIKHSKAEVKKTIEKAEKLEEKALLQVSNAKREAQSIKILANDERTKILDEAKVESKNITAEARIKLANSKEKAEEIKLEAREEASKVISYAETHAKEIAGDAYEAKAKADSYENAIKAMKNTIEGYKDDYIIPNQSVLDDLAEEFNFKEAGEELKAARKRVREMVKDNYAGACDYVEAHRKTYAIHFAVDAFNGKVDSALSKTKHDNFGKIQQEILDAFALVNHNGAPFRNARINQEYLDARLTELKWAVAAFELRKIEKEEQAAIKAQIREEERAIREMEKARKEAEKEEKILQKALDKARAELGQASEEQKAEFEAQLAELEGKLQEAEERGQRALSMAQQTRRGHVYVISNVGSFGEEVFKIGMTRRLEPMDRVKELGDASVPFSFDVHAMIYSDDAPTLEKELHRKFNLQSVNKINPRKEFFRTTIAEVKQAVEQQGLDEVHWTLKAEAAEFRESLAIEKEQQAEAVA
ncbi:GIY-YIG nuclease family protein [Vibrio crassostreae]|uniref:GIY-YIG nuclease family protein n=1 Tax=Vibrio crassostreae TaxID=246167 RepID=UPI001B309BC1|nr:GIY-YIG nuclease family protein [Vibrio crassostreae]